jgi:hypothetical protein
MYLRYLLVSALAVVTAGCLGGVRLEGTLPKVVEGITAVNAIEIADESGAVLLRGSFSAPTVAGSATSRVAKLSGSGTPAGGSATLVTVSLEADGVEETLRIEIQGLAYPSLYRLRIDQKDVSVFTATLSDQISLYLTRRSDGLRSSRIPRTLVHDMARSW